MERNVTRQWLLATVGLFVLVLGLPMLGCERPAGPVAFTLNSLPPGAEVSIGGQSRGHTPLKVEGRQDEVLQVGLDAPGMQPVRRNLVVQPDQTELTWTLDPLPSEAPPDLPQSTVSRLPQVPFDINDRASYAAVDAQAAAVSDADAHSVETLAAALTRGLDAPQDRARAIYTWVATHVTYDLDALFGNKALDERPEVTLRTRCALCGGYARLFEALGRQAGLEVRFVIGNGRGGNINPDNKAHINHAWNTVLLGGKWRLVDSAWGSGVITPQRKYVHRTEDFFFLTPPEQFVYSHWPEDVENECLEHPVTWDEYQALPAVEAEFFTYGMAFDAAPQRDLSCDGNLQLHLRVPADVYLLTQVENDGKAHREWVFSQHQGDGYDIRVALPAPGSYNLRVYARHGQASASEDNSPRAYRPVVMWQVQSSGVGQPSSFPTVYNDFLVDQAYLTSPMDGHLRATQPYTFKVTVPGAVSVGLFSHDHVVSKLSQDGDTFSTTFHPAPGDLYVVPIYPNETEHRSILKYTSQ